MNTDDRFKFMGRRRMRAMRHWVALAATGLCGGCSGLGELPNGDATSSLANPAEQVMAAVTSGLAGPQGSPVEVYSRIARGAHACWLGPHGGLHGTHKFFAETKPEREGGRSKIYLFEKTDDPKNPRGLRAYSISIGKLAGATSVSTKNSRLSAEMDEKMQADVQRWAAGEEGCVAGGINAGWAPSATQTTGNRSR